MEDDVRKIIRTVIQNNKIDPKQESLYLAASGTQHRRDKSQRVDRRKNNAAAANIHAINQKFVQQATQQQQPPAGHCDETAGQQPGHLVQNS